MLSTARLRRSAYGELLLPPVRYAWGGTKERRTPDAQRWLERSAERGFTAPTWPRAYGGAGQSKQEAKILAEEMVSLQVRAPLIGLGLTMISACSSSVRASAR